MIRIFVWYLIIFDLDVGTVVQQQLDEVFVPVLGP